jgi:hypothetical protein
MRMNQADIEIAAEQCERHEVLGPATRFLLALMESVNQQSDGWHSWPVPSKAADKLQQLIKDNTGGMWYPSSGSQITLKDVERTLTPIKRMATYQHEKQKEYGNTYTFDCDTAWQQAKEAR